MEFVLECQLLLMPIIGFSGTLDLSLFDPDVGSFEYDASNNGGVQDGNKHQLSYTRGGDRYAFIATDYGYPGATPSGNIWIMDRNDVSSSLGDGDYFDAVMSLYALKSTHDIRLDGDQFFVANASGARVAMLAKGTLGSGEDRCKWHAIEHPSDPSGNLKYIFESCPITIRAISDDTGEVYRFTSALDGIEFTPSDEDKNIESKLFNSSNVHIGFMTMNVDTGQFHFYDLNRVPF